jgi:2'-hydroxyisoflavone reductase
MHILILGGGAFAGAAFVDSALARGHALTVFNRGRTRHDWPKGVGVLVGDRGSDLGLVTGRRFDAVVDTCGYVPADVRASTAALASCGRYLFVSSISVYASFADAPVRESAALATHDGIADDDRDLAHYGAQKAACEREVEAAFGERALIVRPGLIVGPRDRSGRFSYWPWRALVGGAMLVPDVPAGDPIQVIDVRDLAALMVRLVEDEQSGAYNVTGPAPDTRLDWPRLIDACLAAAAERGAPPAQVVRVAEDFLLGEGVAPWSELPVWVPSSEPSERAFSRIDCTRAIAAGLALRPLAETIETVLAEAPGLVDGDPRRKGKLTPAREAELIARWRAR